MGPGQTANNMQPSDLRHWSCDPVLDRIWTWWGWANADPAFLHSRWCGHGDRSWVSTIREDSLSSDGWMEANAHQSLRPRMVPDSIWLKVNCVSEIGPRRYFTELLMSDLLSLQWWSLSWSAFYWLLCPFRCRSRYCVGYHSSKCWLIVACSWLALKPMVPIHQVHLWRAWCLSSYTSCRYLSLAKKSFALKIGRDCTALPPNLTTDAKVLLSTWTERTIKIGAISGIPCLRDHRANRKRSKLYYL